MLHAEPFETHLLSSELCVLFIYFLKGNCIGLEYHIILSKIHIIVIIKTKIIDQNKSCSNRKEHAIYYLSKKFTDCESRYSMLEKTCCALAWAAKRLRQYMIRHTTCLIS